MSKESAFPLVVLSYSDLMELPDAVLALLAAYGTVSNAVCVFSPHLCGGALSYQLLWL